MVLLVIGFFAQFIDGTVGMGYGAFSESLLIGRGVMPVLASASIHTAEIFVFLFSGVFHLRFGNVRKDWLRLLVIPGVVRGGGSGAYFLASTPGTAIKPFIASFWRDKCVEKLPSLDQYRRLTRVTKDNKRWQEKLVLPRWRCLEYYRRADRALEFPRYFAVLRHPWLLLSPVFR